MLRNKTYSGYYFGIVVEIMVLPIFLLLSIGMVGAQTGTQDALQQTQLQDALQMPDRLEANGTHSVFIQPEPDKVSKTSAIVAVAADPLPGTIFIRDDATGGNCTLIGTWDNSTKTCTLTTNLAQTIQIDNDGITLNGNGHIITGNGAGCGVDLYYRNHVTIKNLIVEKFVSGICLFASDYNNLTNNTASNNSVGINLFHYPSYFNNLTGNTIKNNGVGISIRGHDNNFISNIVSNNSEGFILYYSANNTLKNNTISYNSYTGIFSDWGSVNNKFTSNTISNNPGSGLIVRYGANNSFAENTVSNNSVGIIIANEGDYKIFNNYFNNSNNTQIFFSYLVFGISLNRQELT